MLLGVLSLSCARRSPAVGTAEGCGGCAAPREVRASASALLTRQVPYDRVCYKMYCCSKSGPESAARALGRAVPGAWRRTTALRSPRAACARVFAASRPHLGRSQHPTSPNTLCPAWARLLTPHVTPQAGRARRATQRVSAVRVRAVRGHHSCCSLLLSAPTLVGFTTRRRLPGADPRPICAGEHFQGQASHQARLPAARHALGARFAA